MSWETFSLILIMEFRTEGFSCHFSSKGRAGFVQLDISRFHEVYSICRNIFCCVSHMSVEELDRGFVVSVSEEWLQDEDLLVLTIEPRIVGQVVPEEAGVEVEPRWGKENLI